MVGPNAVTATQLAQEVHVPQPTLSKWLREAHRVLSPTLFHR
jgi:DNA-binding transcriptional LysR family regulator